LVAGVLGRLVSSTNVMLSFSRLRSKDAKVQTSLALGVVAASTMLYFRVVGAASFLNPAVGRAILPFVIRRRFWAHSSAFTGFDVLID